MGEIEFLSDKDVKISAGPSADRLAGRGASQVDAQGHGGASRPLCPDRADRGWQAGLLHEMREPAGTAFAPAAGGTEGGARAGRRAGAGGSAERPFRLVLRPPVRGARYLRQALRNALCLKVPRGATAPRSREMR